MKLEQIKQVARELGLVPGRMRKADLIRSIQGVEGNPQCYNGNHAASCDQTDCLWRDDCK